MSAPQNLDEDTAARLRRRAERHGRSVEAEVGEILRSALAGEEKLARSGGEPVEGLGARLARLAAESGVTAEDHAEFQAHLDELRSRPWRTVDFGG